jgi:hypothetical protein
MIYAADVVGAFEQLIALSVALAAQLAG